MGHNNDLLDGPVVGSPGMTVVQYSAAAAPSRDTGVAHMSKTAGRYLKTGFESLYLFSKKSCPFFMTASRDHDYTGVAYMSKMSSRF